MVLTFGVGLLVGSISAPAEPLPQAERYRENILPILEDRCYDCHGDGSNKGSLALDAFSSDADLVAQTDLWWKVVKNVRARIMPPARKPQLTDAQFEQINQWVQQDIFGIDPDNPDPGRVTIRRLNRVEYRNTVRELMGIHFDTELEFPPDDTGYGFDNIADVLSISPLLLEKYVQAAEAIVREAVPTTSLVMPQIVVPGTEFRSPDGQQDGDRISFYDAAVLDHEIEVKHDGDYRVVFTVHVDGEFAFDPGRCRAIFSINGEPCAEDEFVYAFSDDPDRGASFQYEVDRTLGAGRHQLTIELQPLVDKEERLNRLDFRVKSVDVLGPVDRRHWVRPPHHERFFPDGPAPDDPEARRAYAQRLLHDFAGRAFRRPPEDSVVDALTALAEDMYSQPGRTFEEGIARAMTATLASPRFLFRMERTVPDGEAARHPLIDEWSLASRLSYFFWSTMPDPELFELAAAGRLRDQLDAQIERMLRDERSSELVRHFTGQWLQARNIEHVQVEATAAFGVKEEWDELFETFGRQLWRRGAEDASPELIAARQRVQEIRELTRDFNAELREFMRQETEMSFEHVLKENRSVLEFLDADYAFLNEALAKHYGIPGVSGEALQRVPLPDDSPRGGVLTQGNMLLITSNPTRTSPVKRGLFILENILGTPTPPAPPNIPELEEAADAVTDHEPTLRELLARHRDDPLCSSCHSRIDPLGLAFENFTAVGTWRDQEHNQPIDPSGELITGENFQGVAELKRILATDHRSSFYRCLTEKLLMYALGRGIEPQDEWTIDQIVDRLERNDGRFLELIGGIVESVPFQRRRNPDILSASHAVPGGHQVAQNKPNE